MSASNIVSTLGAGSGIDIKTLAKDLVEAERAPKKAVIEARIGKSEARISGYAAIKFSLSELKNAFSKLNDRSDFSSLKANNTQPSAFVVRTGPSAPTGSYSVSVEQVASGQRSASAGFAAVDTPLTPNAAPFSLNLRVGTAVDDLTIAAQTIQVDTATPEGIVSAINGAKLGLTAQIINSGDAINPFTIVVSGPEGEAQRFSLTSASGTDGTGAPVAGVDFSRRLQEAQNAMVTVNGLSITRPTNTISNVVEGVSFDILDKTTSTARVDLTRETGNIKESLKSLVAAYNEFQDVINILGDRSSDVEEFGGSLAGDSLLTSVRNQIRSLVTTSSSTPGATVSAARHVGLEIDRDGRMTLDESKLDQALDKNFSEVVRMFSANTNNQSVYSAAPGGLAGDAVNAIDRMLRSTGEIERQSKGAATQIERSKTELSTLEMRMEKLLARYMNQFSVMESIVGQSNSLRTNLKGSFEAMMNAYKN